MPGLRAFAGTDTPIDLFGQAQFVQDTKSLSAGFLPYQDLARNFTTSGGLVWAFYPTTTSNAHIIADDVIIEAGTDALTAENPALGSVPGIQFADVKELAANPENGTRPGLNIQGSTIRNGSGSLTYWSFAKHPRFMDIVRYTGDDGASRFIEHSLDRAPGMIMVKRTDAVGNWAVYHNKATSAPEDVYLSLSTNAAATDDATYWVDTPPTEDGFTVGTALNADTATYIAILFADDDRGNGCIRTGSYTGNGAGGVPLQEIGWKPAWLMVKQTSSSGSWRIYDRTRPDLSFLKEGVLPDDSTTRTITTTFVTVNSLGWETDSSGSGDEGLNESGQDYVWLAIRDDPDRFFS